MPIGLKSLDQVGVEGAGTGKFGAVRGVGNTSQKVIAQAGGLAQFVEADLATGGGEVGHRLIALLLFGEEAFFGIVCRAGPNQGKLFGLLAGGEHALKAVVVSLVDGFGFVVVAAGAGHGEAQQAAGYDIDAVVEDVVWVVEESSANSEEAEGGEIFTAIPTWGMKKVGG